MQRLSHILRAGTALKAVFQRLGGTAANARPTTSTRRQELEDAGEVRPSRRRFDGFNTKGRSERVRKIIDRLQCRDPTMRDRLAALPLREQLDVLRELWHRSNSKKVAKRSNGLEKFASHKFGKSYYFREEDLQEESTLGRGPGGQATNRRMQTVILRHHPSGLVVKFSKFPSLWLNRRAARELLNLRLEEHLIGPRSVLGMQKQQRLKSDRRKRLRRESLVRFAKKQQSRNESVTLTDGRAAVDFFGFLNGSASLPAGVVKHMAEACPDDIDASRKELFVDELFNAQCHNWWPLLERQFSNESALPVFFHYVFPTVPDFDDSIIAIEEFVGPLTRGQTKVCRDLERCRNSEQVLENVRRALRCVVEVFGLTLRERIIDPATQTKRIVLEKDGLSWVEHRCRMLSSISFVNFAPQDANASPLAQALFPHIFRSLTQLHMIGEAAAVKRFFVVESKTNVRQAHGTPEGKVSCCWAARLLQRFCPYRKKPDSVLES